MNPTRQTYTVEIAGLHRDFPLFQVAPHVSIAIFNMLGDTELVQACARELTAKLAGLEYDVLVTAEAKSIPLAHVISVISNKPYVILRKTYKPYMGVALTSETLSITTGQPQMLYLDEKDHQLLRGRKIVLMDDVISTGSTLKGMQQLMEKADAQVIATAAVFTEGEGDWSGVIALGNLPLFKS